MMDFRKVRKLSARMKCGCNPLITKLHVNQQVKNADDTKDDIPVVCDTWISYWKTFTMEDIPTTCPLCGKALTEDEADGCHILIKPRSIISNDDYSKKEYIIPGHHECNCQFGEDFKLKIGIGAVEAIKKEINQETDL